LNPLQTLTGRLTSTDTDIQKIVTTCHAWRREKNAGAYADTAGFCKSATTVEIAEHGHVLTPRRYVGAEEVETDSEPFEEKDVATGPHESNELFAESEMLEQAIKANPRWPGYG